MANSYVNLMCGGCGSQLELNTDFEEAAWLLVYRFANAHVKCEFVLPDENVEYAFSVDLPELDCVREEDEAQEPEEDDGDGYIVTVVE